MEQQKVKLVDIHCLPVVLKANKRKEEGNEENEEYGKLDCSVTVQQTYVA